MTRLWTALLTLGLALPVGAQPTDGADPVAAAAARGERAFEDGHYQAAIDAYVEAYQMEPLTPLLFNVAYIYDAHLDEPTLARDYYRRYVAAPDPEPAARIRAFERISAIDERLLRAKARAEAPPPPAPAPPPPPLTSTSSRATFGYIGLGVGAAALATGVVLAALTRSTQTEFDDASDVLARRDLGDQGRSQALAADVSLGVSFALLGVGAWLLLSDEPAESSTGPETSSGPAVIDRAAGWAWQGRF